MAKKKQPPRLLSSFDDLDASGIGAGYTPYVQDVTEPVEVDQQKPRGMFRAIGDTAVQFGKGAVTGVRMMSDVLGADNAVSGGLRNVDEALNGLLSATAKQDQAQVASIMQEAEGKGWMEQIGMGLKAAGVAPAALLAQAAGTALPTIAASLVTGGAGPMAAAARFAAPALMGGAQGVGATKGAIYEEVKQRLLKDGASEADAEARAVAQQSYGGPSSGQIALGGLGGFVAGSTGMERASAGLRGGVAQAAPGLATRMVRGGVVEAVPEGFQGGHEKYATNSALNNEGYNIDPMSGVVANATLEAAAGAPLGAAFGIPNPGVNQPPGQTAPSLPPAAPPAGPMSRAVQSMVPSNFTATPAGASMATAPVTEAGPGFNAGNVPAITDYTDQQDLNDLVLSEQRDQQVQLAQIEQDRIKQAQIEADFANQPTNEAIARAGALEAPGIMAQAFQGAQAKETPPEPPIAPVQPSPPEPRIVERTADMQPMPQELAELQVEMDGGEVVKTLNQSGKFAYHVVKAAPQAEPVKAEQPSGDILNAKGQPFTNLFAAKTAASKAGDGFAPVQVGQHAYVVRKADDAANPDLQFGDSASPGAVSPEPAPGMGLGNAAGNAVATQPERLADAVLGQAGELPRGVDASPLTENARVQDPQAGAQAAPVEAPGAPTQAVAGAATGADNVPGAAGGAVEGGGISQAEAGNKLAPTNSSRNPDVWVLKEKSTGNVIMETRDRKKVDALNTEKYEAVPLVEHLQSLTNPTPEPISRADIPNDQKPDATPEQVETVNEAEYQRSIKDGIQQRLGLVKEVIQNEKKTPFKSFLQRFKINTAHTADIFGKNSFKANNILPATFATDGPSLDMLAERAVEYGLLTENDPDKLIAMIQSESFGDKQVSSEFANEDAQQQGERVQRMEIESLADKMGLPYDNDTSTDRLASMVNRVSDRVARAPKDGLLKPERILKNAQETVARIERKRAQYERENVRFVKASIEEQDALLELLNDADGNPAISLKANRQAVEQWYELNPTWTNQNESDAGANQDSGQAGTSDTSAAQERAENGRGTGAQAQPRSPQAQDGEGQEGLTATTPTQLRADAERTAQVEQDKAKSDKDAEAKAKAERIAKEIQSRQDASADNFTLGQSAEDSLAGQGSVFDAPAALPKIGRFESILVPDETTRWMGFDGRKSVRADLAALALRHPEYYDSAQQVRGDIEFVLGNPDGWYIHKGNKVVLFRERSGQGAIPQSRIEVEAEADTLSVRSVYVGGKRQIAKKMADKREVLGGLDLGGQSPESLSIAEYLAVLGNVSSRPASPSGEVLKADESIGQAAPEIKPAKIEDSGEMPAIRAAFDHFFDTVQTKEDDTGNVAMFSRATQDAPSGVLSKDGTFKGWPKYNAWTRQEYSDVVSLLPDAYRNDPHRREPVAAKDWDALAAAVVPELDALNKVSGPGTFRLDGLGNILVDQRKSGRDAVVEDALPVAQKHGLGIFITGVRTDAIAYFRDAGFDTETGLGAILQRAAKTNQPPIPYADNIYGNPAHGTIMSYKPRGFSSVLFSRGASDAESRNALQALSQNDSSFQYEKSDSDTVAGIAADIDPDIQVKVITSIPGETRYVFTNPDGDTQRMSVRPFNPYANKEAGTLYGFNLDENHEMTDIVSERPGNNPEHAMGKDDVYIDVSMMLPGNFGSAIYAIATNYAHNSGKIFIGDPVGLSDKAMKRRIDSMLSSALKFGTTEHLAPHPRQVKGDLSIGVPALDWTYGDDLANIRSLIEVSNAIYGPINPITFEPSSGRFVDSQGAELDADAIRRVVKLGRPGKTGLGVTTAKRSAVLSSLVQEGGGTSGRTGVAGNDILGKLLALRVQHPLPTKGIFYSRGVAPKGLPTKQVQAIVDAIKSRWANAPEVFVVDNMDDPAIPQAVRDANAKQQSKGATGEPEGFYYAGKVYVVASAMSKPGDVTRVMLHETLGHAGLRGVFGDALNGILKQIIALRKPLVAAKAEAYGLDMSKPDEAMQAAEEVLAEMAQTHPEIGYVKRAIAAIKAWMRKHVPGFSDMKLTDADIINDYILPARDFIERRDAGKSGGQGPEGGVKFSAGDSTSSDLQRQFQATAEAAGGVDAYSKARDSGKTVLTYKQWVQVRTPNFKKWWGYDWESEQLSNGSAEADGQREVGGRDPGVDGPIAREFTFIHESTKEPSVFYHGTRDAFTVFDPDSEGKKDHGWLGRGHYVSSDHWTSDYYSKNKTGTGRPVVMELFVRPNNPKYFYQRQKSAMSRANIFQVKKLTQEWRDKGHNGAALHSADGPIELSVYDNNGLKSATDNTGDFDTSNADIRFSMGSRLNAAINDRQTKIVGPTTRQHTPEQLRAMANVGFQVEAPSLKERAQALWKDAGKKMAQGIFDQFAPVKDMDKTAYGLLRLAKGASGAFEAMLHGGKLKLSNNVYDFDEQNRGGVVDTLLIPLQGEHHDFMRWVAANRAERLQGEGKENLFSPQDIADLKTLASGQAAFDFTLKHGPQAGTVTRDRALIYADSLKTFNAFNKNVLDMAEQSGLIDGAGRQVWEHEFYVPFYRVADEDGGGVRGMNIKGSVVRQQAFKQLKGGKGSLNADLLDNTLMNWAHLLDAAAKNRAAKATIESAEALGVAVGGNQATLAQMGASINNKNGVVWFMDGGIKRYSLIDKDGDGPYLMEALGALEYAGMRNPVMNAMGAMKHVLTVGVTASPFFKVRNLIRDSVSVIGTSRIGVNPLANVATGWKLTDPKSDAYFRLLAGGGTIHFGTMLEGSEAKRIQALVESGVDAGTILGDDHKVKAFYRKFIEPGISAYNELGNRGEAINRATLYDQLVRGGMNHADASLQARDLMDFSMQGTFTTIRFLSQTVPFLNARLQGLYKLGRAAKEDPARMSAVIGATTLFSLALLAAYHDDDDWEKREEWDRNGFWWFKFGGVAFRIPKPFEIGAMATLAERGFELAFDKEMTGGRFGKQVMTLLGDNLSMNPVPQLIKPIVDVYANKNSFTGRPIESMSMERLKPEYRFNGGTSMTARGLSTAANSVTNLIGVDSASPVQIDHMLRGYFGWLGSFIIGAGDVLARPATSQVGRAAPDIWKTATGSMISDLRDAPSRYVSQMYDQAKEIDQAYGTWRALQKGGESDEAKAFAEDNRELLRKRGASSDAKRRLSVLNERIRSIERGSLDADAKRVRIRQINQAKEQIARTLN